MDQAMEEWRQVFRELIQAEKVWDPDTGRKPHSQSPAARLETVPAGGPRLVSGECDGMHSRKFFLISDCVYLLLFLFRSMPVN